MGKGSDQEQVFAPGDSVAPSLYSREHNLPIQAVKGKQLPDEVARPLCPED